MSQAPAIPTQRKLFTRQSAEAALVLVSRIVLDVARTHLEIVKTRRQIERTELGLTSLTGLGVSALEDQYRGHLDRLRELVGELDQIGVDLHDFERGIVTFPTVTGEGDRVFTWSLAKGGPPRLTTIEQATARVLKGGID